MQEWDKTLYPTTNARGLDVHTTVYSLTMANGELPCFLKYNSNSWQLRCVAFLIFINMIICHLSCLQTNFLFQVSTFWDVLNHLQNPRALQEMPASKTRLANFHLPHHLTTQGSILPVSGPVTGKSLEPAALNFLVFPCNKDE